MTADAAPAELGIVFDLVPPENVQTYWDLIYSPMVQSALDYSVMQFDGLGNVYERLMNGDLFMVQITDRDIVAVAIHEVVETVDGRFLHVYALAGERMDEWLDEYIERLHAMAELLNCRKVSCTGRPGWHKRLRRYGFNTKYVTMTMEANHVTG